MIVYKCKMCGGSLEFNEGDTTGVCAYCGTKQTLPKIDDERRANLYDRAGHYRRANEFDKAESLYEQILEEDTTDAEAYWSLVLCRYGIEYVEDPKTRKRVPTVNRVQYTSIYDDENYKAAIKNAYEAQRYIYEDEAKTINEIQKGILDISSKEEPFDVFISYKENDESTHQRTQDSVMANDLYDQLTEKGYKVFFSRITLEDKLGTAYEPYIFAALNSAKVMVVIGSKLEYFNAPWVRNEWSRYLSVVKDSKGKKVLIPVYKDIDPYDLPAEFSHLQAQDMSKIGFMQDLIRGIGKVVAFDKRAEEVESDFDDPLGCTSMTITSTSTESLDSILDAAEKALLYKDNYLALSKLESATKNYPNDPRGWMELLKLQTNNFTVKIVPRYVTSAVNYDWVGTFLRARRLLNEEDFAPIKAVCEEYLKENAIGRGKRRMQELARCKTSVEVSIRAAERQKKELFAEKTIAVINEKIEKYQAIIREEEAVLEELPKKNFFGKFKNRQYVYMGDVSNEFEYSGRYFDEVRRLQLKYKVPVDVERVNYINKYDERINKRMERLNSVCPKDPVSGHMSIEWLAKDRIEQAKKQIQSCQDWMNRTTVKSDDSRIVRLDTDLRRLHNNEEGSDNAAINKLIAAGEEKLGKLEMALEVPREYRDSDIFVLDEELQKCNLLVNDYEKFLGGYDPKY